MLGGSDLDGLIKPSSFTGPQTFHVIWVICWSWFHLPIQSMYGISTYVCLNFMVNAEDLHSLMVVAGCKGPWRGLVLSWNFVTFLEESCVSLWIGGEQKSWPPSSQGQYQSILSGWFQLCSSKFPWISIAKKIENHRQGKAMGLRI